MEVISDSNLTITLNSKTIKVAITTYNSFSVKDCSIINGKTFTK
ncbi:hypothetical protein THZG08_170034 [Vibrio owensii]|uniref:Uncharacterized protein n=1 Tax=Vibrio owensii TaxID=696485 RepID=A0AAU9Q9G3_9VIBR|nr:hypothetical protein THZG08_170034 [Vibrio owensii]CAH1535314.1 hypothetical protein THF1D04_40152 [Vibrio owensii]CAH1554686.1 hypothetical protein THOA03_170088 [Vibrio owensii]